MTSRKIEWKRFIWRDTTPICASEDWWDRIFYFWDETFIRRIRIQRTANNVLSKI